MKNILLTGGAGFIGSHLCKTLLKQNYQVLVLDNFHDFYDYKIKLNNLSFLSETPVQFSGEKDRDISNFIKKTKSNQFELVYGDIRNEEILESIFKKFVPDMLVHLAALAGVRPSIEQPIEYESVNINGTMKLWEMCKRYKVSKFVCASSSSVYGNNTQVPFAETDVVDFAISPYAATKKAGEVLGHVYHSLYGIDMIQLRFFTVYGPRQRPDLAIHKFTKLISQGKSIPFYGDGNTARDYTYIDDIIDGVVKSMEYLQQKSGVYEILNLGESQVISLSQMLATIEKNLGIKAKINKLPMQAGDVNMTNADISKAKNMIGYAPKTGFETGISKFIDWFRENQGRG